MMHGILNIKFNDIYFLKCVFAPKNLALFFNNVIDILYTYYREIIVGIATRYRLDGKGIESL
jgi:hypothetical protein